MGWLNVCLILYALIMLAGGIGGWRMAGSQASLWTGVISAALLLGAAALAKTNPKAGYGLATLVVVVLIGVFIERYLKTQKFMPSGMLIAGSLVMLLLLVVGHFLGRQRVV
jgi:uncharacterized membrane protein (UPF0136 family)